VISYELLMLVRWDRRYRQRWPAVRADLREPARWPCGRGAAPSARATHNVPCSAKAMVAAAASAE